MNNKKIIFFGTPAFSAVFLESLLHASYTIIAVITAPDKHVGRKRILTPTPVKKVAETFGIPVLQPSKIDAAFIKSVEQLRPDLGIVIAYGKIIPLELIMVPPLGIINIHPSRLPKYRGPSPIQYALLNNDSKTAIDIMQIDVGMDTGDILFEKEIDISLNDHFESLQKKIAKIGSQFLLESLPYILSGDIHPNVQNNAAAVYTKKIVRTDGLFIPEESTVQDLVLKGRAFYPWPGLYFIYNGQRIKISLPKGYQNNFSNKVRKLFITEQNECAILCKDGYIIPKTIQIEGKKSVENREFVKGYSHLCI